jgi:hypothetical protein
VGLGVAAAKSWRTGRVYSLLRFSMKLKNASGLQFEGALEVVAKDGKAQLKLLGMAGANAKVTAPEIDGLARRALSIARGNNFLLPPTPAAMPGDLTRSASATAGVEIVCDATSPGSQWKIYGVAQVVVVINLPANGSVTLATGTKRQLYPAPP